MEQRHERAAARQPDRRLSRRVAAADDPDPRRSAPLRLGRARSVEDADALVVLEVVDRQPAVVRAGGEHDGARRDLSVVLQPDDVAIGSRLERERPVRRRGSSVELPRLGHRAARELGAGDAGREAEVVLDAPGGPRLTAEHGALDHERVKAL